MKKTILVPVVIEVCNSDEVLCGDRCSGFPNGSAYGVCRHFRTKKGNYRALRRIGFVRVRCQECFDAQISAGARDE